MPRTAASDPDELMRRAITAGKRTLIIITAAALLLQVALMLFL